jgi:hypothetical protein
VEDPSWLTLLGHAKDSLWSLDLFRVESVLLKVHWTPFFSGTSATWNENWKQLKSTTTTTASIKD